MNAFATGTGRRRVVRGVAGAGALLAAVVLSGCATPGAGPTGDPAPHLVPLVAAASTSAPAHMPGWRALIRSKRKIFGVSMSGAPASMAPVRALAKQVHKTPNAVEYYQDWGQQFDTVRAEQACSAGILPALTWESWNWSDKGASGGTAITQPAYAPRVIAHGKYDAYIRATARAIKSIHCSLLLRFDQEPNGDWYPWGIGTVGMHNTSAQYVAMWRHVWRIFHNQHVNNVVWSWSPNLLLPRHYPLRALYPGNHYVDIVGLDGYLWHPHDTVHSILGALMHGLSKFASKRPWFVAETGVASGSHQPQGIHNLLRAVATNKHLHGFVYLDEPEPRADWSFGSHPASVRAFRNGIARHVYGHAHH